MAAFRNLINLFVFCLWCMILSINAEDQCPCDLTVDACDANCCCDKTCEAKDLRSFVCRDDSLTKTLDDRLCIKKSLIYSMQDTANATVNETSNKDLLCIYYDNYAKRNYYEEVAKIETIESLNHYIGNYSTFSYQRPSTEILNFTKYYKSGDPIYAVYKVDGHTILGLFRLPKNVNSKMCSRFSPVAYLESVTSTCTEDIPDLEKACDQGGLLNAALYSDGLRLLGDPDPLQFLNQNITNSQFDIRDDTDLRGVYDNGLKIERSKEHECFKDGKPWKCPEQTTAFENDTCKNAVIKVAYDIVHRATDGISRIRVKFTYRDVNGTDLPLSQTFSLRFIRETDDGKLPTRQKSGNPGYVVGQPVVVGNLGTNRIDLSKRDNRDYLVLIKPSIGQECDMKFDNLHTVTFGEDVRTGCLIKRAKDNKGDCSDIHKTIMDMFKFNNLKDAYVATYGNSSTDVEEWVPFSVTNEPQETQKCEGMTLGINFRFLYAKTGALANPQPKIVAAAIEYGRKQSLQLKCVGSFCTDDVQFFEVIQTVSFVDVSKPATAVAGILPIFHAKLPRDFFYPFLTSVSSRLEVAVFGLVGSVLMAVVCSVFL